jgi:predicted nucleotidyltransferase
MDNLNITAAFRRPSGTVIEMQRLPIQAIRQLCRRRRIRRLFVFGSALREDFGPASDIDLLVEFAPGHHPDWQEWLALQEELTRLLGHPVDLVERQTIEQSRNYLRRKHILSHLEPVYVEG